MIDISKRVTGAFGIITESGISHKTKKAVGGSVHTVHIPNGF